MLSWIKRKHGLVLIIILAFLFLAGDGVRIIQFPPRSTHIFRQSDCLAYTKTYYQRNSDFFTPSAYNLIGRGGRVVSEFPILYYLSAKLCRLIGFHYWIIRGLTFLSCIIGLYYLLLCCRLWINDLFLSLFTVVILASTPYYFFYAVNYLPNVPAISFSFVGLYYILLYRQSNALKHLAISTVFFSLSCLLKPTDGGLIWVAYFAPVMMNITTTAKINKKSATLLFTSLITVTLCIISWFLFVKWYNNVNGNNINLQGFYPIWEMSSDEILKTFQLRMFTSDRDIFQHTSILLLLIVFLIIYIVKWKSLDKFLRCLTLWIIIFAVIYSPLWFKAFFIHDYYMLLFAVPAAFLSITVIQWFEKKIFPRLGNRARFAVYGTLAGLMIISIYHNQYIQLQRYGDKSMGVDNPAIYEVEPYLRKIGISETDSVLSVPDGTPNITLSIFGNPGYTSDLFGADTYNPKYCKEHGIKYMIITDANRIHSPIYEPYTSKLIGEYKGIYIYDIR